MQPGTINRPIVELSTAIAGLTEYGMNSALFLVRRNSMNYFSDEELEGMSTEEIIQESYRGLINLICMIRFDYVMHNAEENIYPPNEELGESWLNDYECLKKSLTAILKPEYHQMMIEEHAEVFRKAAGKRLSTALNWDNEPEE
jgi:hypothetical protein